ncbi:3-deoxy-D-manno-octulosonic acid transferase [Desulfonema magnum]|uniref:3-deoxy-D-manno-octulosonic acid transferase n=1 Tax=Desulfonema magnum TaxID=45655 RepID=A0A975BR40_9BACT|nr:glycosyltransferase N-terminal domain-containing protein [Desulfonema magnum]QTA90035.1 3-deoxy-D-manno-octulosonic-acid transferase N-terminal domain-containing protein [Desulfonema magnum]
MSKSITVKTAFWLYNAGWNLAMPILRRNQRLAEGFEQRTLRENMPESADIWIQAASAGESYLAWLLIKNLKPDCPIKILLTSNTRQGMEILARAIDDISPNDRGVSARAAYFPFDKPAIMEKAVRFVRPRIMVLLETELWPGLLSALKKYGSEILLINGRISPGSLERYCLWPSFWHSLSPDKILAISENDARRFGTLFGIKQPDVMQNMKFDRIDRADACLKNPLEKIFPSDTPLLVLGSTRQEEEPLIEKIILSIRRRHPDAVIGLFPRHMHRIEHWKAALDRMEIPWTLRSELTDKTQKSPFNGITILWDMFGELSLAYELSKAAFVGGSLAPLGGQNFLEALVCGVIPVIGPFWENFAWVGHDISKQGLVHVAGDWKAAADMLTKNMESSPPHEAVREAALTYVKNRQGGTIQACNLILQCLSQSFFRKSSLPYL